MPVLTIEKDERLKGELTAKLDGIELPSINKIEIVSVVGQMTKLNISFIVGMVNDNYGILIKESALMK